MADEKKSEEVMNPKAENSILPVGESEQKNEEKKDVVSEKKKKVIPKLFFNRDNRILVNINAYHDSKTGELSFVTVNDKDEADEEENEGGLYIKMNYKFWFSYCPYNDLNRYRSRSMIYNSEDQINTVNLMVLHEYLLIFHLVDWNLTDEEGKKIELEFDPNKALSDKSLKLIYTLPPVLIDTVLTPYERKIGVNNA